MNAQRQEQPRDRQYEAIVSSKHIATGEVHLHRPFLVRDVSLLSEIRSLPCHSRLSNAALLTSPFTIKATDVILMFHWVVLPRSLPCWVA